jgi:hypothetical protein
LKSLAGVFIAIAGIAIEGPSQKFERGEPFTGRTG